MDNLKLAQLAERLLRAGVAPRHVQRSVEELRAHRTDLLAQLSADGVSGEEAERTVEARLGSVETCYAATVARPELLSWSHRRPGVVFVMLPVLAFIALVVACVALTVGLAQLVQPEYKLRGVVSPGVRTAGEFLRLLILWGVPAFVAAFSVLLAARRRLRPWWPALGVLLIAFLGSGTTMQVSWAAVGTPGSLQAGFGYPVVLMRALSVIAGVLLPYVVWVYTRRRLDAADQRADE